MNESWLTGSRLRPELSAERQARQHLKTVEQAERDRRARQTMYGLLWFIGGVLVATGAGMYLGSVGAGLLLFGAWCIATVLLARGSA